MKQYSIQIVATVNAKDEYEAKERTDRILDKIWMLHRSLVEDIEIERIDEKDNKEVE
jgi:hypothetical protein